jgi:DNA-binding NarL/FixJ family response regulator
MPLRVVFWLEDARNRDILVAAIQPAEGIELVLATGSGVEALDVAGRHAVDVVVFDADAVSMAQLRRLVEAFRMAAEEVRLVALTSSSGATSIRELLAAGLDSAISKSIRTEDFGYVLRQSGRNASFDSVLDFKPPSARTSIAS